MQKQMLNLVVLPCFDLHDVRLSLSMHVRKQYIYLFIMHGLFHGWERVAFFSFSNS